MGNIEEEHDVPLQRECFNSVLLPSPISLEMSLPWLGKVQVSWTFTKVLCISSNITPQANSLAQRVPKGEVQRTLCMSCRTPPQAQVATRRKEHNVGGRKRIVRSYPQGERKKGTPMCLRDSWWLIGFQKNEQIWIPPAPWPPSNQQGSGLAQIKSGGAEILVPLSHHWRLAPSNVFCARCVARSLSATGVLGGRT